MKAAAPKSSNEESQQFLTFLLEDQEYGLELLTIQEIRGFTTITPVPNVLPHIRGVINLRGTVLPVVDLRVRFGLPPMDYNKFTVIVIARVADRILGLLVDAVSDVLDVSKTAMRAAPDFGNTVDTRFIEGVFETRERLAVALDLGQLLEDSEVPITQAAA